MLQTVRAGVKRNRPAVVATAAILAGALIILGALLKQPIHEALRSGQTIHAEFAGAGKLATTQGLAPASKVKIAGSPVGQVTGVEGNNHGTVNVTLKVAPGTKANLGSNPSATIRPTTALGGTYFVELEPGGTAGAFAGSFIPISRTQLPVELDTVLQAVPQQAQRSLRDTAAELHGGLQGGGSSALNQVLGQAPATLGPTASVAQAALGTDPSTDLPRLVTDLDRTATVVTARNGQLGNVVDLLDQTTAALSSEAPSLGDTLANLPQTLSATKTGLTSLQGTLRQLIPTAQVAEPSIQRIDPLLSALNPVLVHLRPLLAQLQPVLQQAQPLVNRLVPTAGSATTILDEVRGPVLAKVNGPIIGTIMHDWKGLGPKYAGGGQTGNTFYQEAAYLLSNVDRASWKYTQNGHLVDFTGVGTPGDLQGLPPNVKTVLSYLLSGVGVPGGGGLQPGAGGPVVAPPAPPVAGGRP